ncbi:MAG: alpha/beta hydrolase [Acidimicrobiia bacterium]|nr:alpha/beta hydrolase [Acidimicrobiia bacterium]MDH5520941.1 alpha/beta hydrolase [Acidimicrobiia bacterium]
MGADANQGVKIRKLVLAGAAAAALSYGGTKAMIWRWRKNLNPLAGEPLTFPVGTAATVKTDDGARLAIRRSGSGPTVVLVHGLTGNRDDWGPVARRLITDGFEVVAIELRGHGDSSPGRDGYGPRRLAGDLAQALSALDLSDVILVGHSMGGIASMTLMLEHPELAAERVRKLAVVASTATLQQPQTRYGLQFLSVELLDRFTRFDERLRLGTGLVAFGRHPNLELVDYLIESTARCPHDVRREATAALVDYEISDQLHRIGHDTLVIGGTNDWLTPLRYSRQIANGIPRARLQIINGGGHMIMFEAADRIGFLLAEFARLSVRAATRR